MIELVNEDDKVKGDQKVTWCDSCFTNIFNSNDAIFYLQMVGKVFLVDRKGRFAFIGLPETRDLGNEIEMLLENKALEPQ